MLKQTISLIDSLANSNPRAFGGFDTGNMNARDDVTPTGNIRYKGLFPISVDCSLFMKLLAYLYILNKSLIDSYCAICLSLNISYIILHYIM